MVQLAEARLPFLTAQDADWWHQTRPFFDVSRERIWIFWRRVLHDLNLAARYADHMIAMKNGGVVLQELLSETAKNTNTYDAKNPLVQWPGDGGRIDTGVMQGMEISPYYDPMIAKLVATAQSREAAIEKMIRAIDEFEITGIETTLGFCRFVMQHESFRSGNFDTRFVENFFSPQALAAASSSDEELIAAILSISELNTSPESPAITQQTAKTSLWKKNRLAD